MSKRTKKVGQGRGSRRGSQNGQARCEPLESRRLLTGEFTDLGNLGLPGALRAGAEWGDYDNDGDLDVAVAGSAGGAPFAAVYRNDGGTFVNANAGLTGVFNGTLAWGDYDRDGDLDLLVSGRLTTAVPVVSSSKVYRNDNGTFVDIEAPLLGVRYNSVDWGDYDNDGDLDILLAGRSGSNNLTNQLKIYRNDGSSFTDVNASLPGLSFGDVQWGDYDGDGDLDIFASGTGTSGERVTQILRNDGNAVFTNISAALPVLTNTAVDWGDYDNDGDLDLLLIGQESSGQPRSDIYRNEGAGVFTNINANLTGLFYGAAKWGDYDNDGDLDAMMIGRTGGSASYFAKLYRNNGSAGFAEVSAGLAAADLNAIHWGDYDNDGDLDVLHIGRFNGNATAASILRNNATTANTVPNAPTGLGTTVLSPTQLRFTWSAPSDAQTSTPGLSYNLRVGTTPGGSDVIAPSALSSGKRTISQRGNVQGTSFTLTGLTPGQTYYWSVQAIDSAFAASAFATASQQTLPKLDQSINFTQPTSPIQFAPNQQVSLVATGGASGNPVVFSIDPSSTGAGSIAGNVLTITAPGTFVINANQAGAFSYNAAAQVQRTLSVRQESLVVTTAVDENDGTSDVTFGSGTSLREALIYANANPGADTITFATSLAGQTVTLSQGWDNTDDDNALEIGSDVTIQGLTGNSGVTLAVEQSASRRHFLVATGAHLTLSHLTLTGGEAVRSGAGFGGAVWNFGSLTVNSSTFTNNHAAQEGGAIQSWGAGGSLLLQITNSTFAGNSTSGNGSAIGTGANTNVFDHLTVVDNVAPSANGTFWIYDTSVTMTNSIVARNTNDGASTFGSGTFAAGSTHNLVGAGSWTGLNPASNNSLGVSSDALSASTLSNHGGPTPTIALQAKSLALNAGTGSLATDQRGIARPQIGAPDIGAFEARVSDLSLTSVTTPDGALWFLLSTFGNDQRIYRQAPGQEAAEVGGLASYIGLQADGNVVVRNAGGAVFTRPNSATGVGDDWSFRAPTLAGDGATWFLGTDGTSGNLNSYRWSADGSQLNFAGGAGTRLDAIGGVIITQTVSGDVFYRNGSNTGLGDAWVQTARATAGDGATWFVFASTGNSGSIYRYAANAAPADSNGNGVSLSVTPAGDVRTVTAGAQTFQRIGSASGLGTEWRLLSESLVVTTILDENDFTSSANFGSGTSLREAIDFANASPGLDTITFSPGLIAAGQAVELAFGATGSGDDTALRVLSDLTIDGGGVTISYIGSAGRRHFASFNGSTFTLRNLTLTGGNITGVNDGGALWTSGNVNIERVRFIDNEANNGGAIQNFGSVSINDTVFEGNTASAEGGAINNSGTLTVADTLFYLNGAFNGGAINSANGLTIDRTTFSTNSASFNGGALRLFGTSVINTAALTNNTATNGGGGLISHGNTTLTNVTIAHNAATNGGGAQLFEGTAALRHVTIAYNQATQSGGGMMVNSADTTLTNTIIAGNSAGASENNLWGGPLNAASAGNLLDVSAAAAGLGVVGNYGGPVQTVPLLPGSGAIDIGLNLSTIDTDARALSRLSGAAPDAGAFESRPFTLSVTGGSGQTASLNPGNVGNSNFGVVTITVSSASGDPVAGGVVTLTGPGNGASISPTPIQATIGSNGTATFTPRPNGIAGTYDAVVSAAGASASPSVSLTNAKISADVSFGNLSFTYDGTAKIAIVTTTPGGLAVLLTYTLNGFTVPAPTLAGTYRVTATINDPSYQGSASADLVIAPANVTSRVSVAGSAFRVDTRTGRALQTLTLKNTSATAIQGRLILRLAGLPSGVSVLGATQLSAGIYELSQPINLAAGASFSLNLTFLNAARQRIGYVPTFWLDGLV